MQWVAAHPLSRIVVVVFVVILSVVVVVCRPGPSSSAFAPSLAKGTLQKLDQYGITRRGSATGGVSAGRSTTGKRWRMTTTTERMTTKITITIRDNDLRQQQLPRRYPANRVREGAYS